MVLDLLLIGLGITLEPFPLIAFLLILSAAKGAGKGLAFILGWLACLVVVIAGVVLVTGGKPPQPSTAPSTAVLTVKLALGVVLIFFAVRKWRRMGRPRQPPGWMARLDRLSPWAAAGLAAFLQPWALVAAAAATVTQAKLSSTAGYLTLLLFCLLATSMPRAESARTATGAPPVAPVADVLPAPAMAGSGEDLRLLTIELRRRDNLAIAQISQLGQLVGGSCW